MNKQELIQTHQLLALIKNDAEDRGVVDETPQYEEVGVKSNDIHRSKESHKDAILSLGDDLATAFEESETESETVEAEAETVAP